MPNEENVLWDELCKEKSLQEGWHLTRMDMQQDFIQDPYARETFAYFLNDNLTEILRLLKTGDFRPQHLTRIAIPKGALATRPGTLLPLKDRVVLFSALNLIAENIDKQLIDGVYSYRVKKNRKSKSSLFYEGDAIALPFLKSTTVKKYIDPFDPWYGLWPKFDAISKQAFQEGGYRYMATSDIAAYFENIQLEILRDLLHQLLPREQKIINLFITAFASWTYDTIQGRRYLRGIPQGSQISSFFGNIFLKPIDDAFAQFKNKKDIKYFRYMDDIRIFAKDRSDARAAILLLDQEIRRLHLNLQSAKTKIYDEKYGEITVELIDRRFAQLDEVTKQIKEIKEDANRAGTVANYSPVLSKLKAIANAKPTKSNTEQRISKARKPLSGLTNRVFRRLVTQHLSIDDKDILPRLISEANKNPDFRLGLKLVQCAKKFPRNLNQKSLINFLQSEETILPMQEAQILEALRYHSRLQKDTIEYVVGKASDDFAEEQIRIQAFHLLARVKLDKKLIDLALKIYKENQSIRIKKAASLLLIRQRGKANSNFVREVVFHPNEDLNRLGKLYRAGKNDTVVAKYLLEQAFRTESLLVDYIPLLYLMAESNSPLVRQEVKKHILTSKAHTKHINMDMRDRCKEVLNVLGQNSPSNAQEADFQQKPSKAAAKKKTNSFPRQIDFLEELSYSKEAVN